MRYRFTVRHTGIVLIFALLGLSGSIQGANFDAIKELIARLGRQRTVINSEYAFEKDEAKKVKLNRKDQKVTKAILWLLGKRRAAAAGKDVDISNMPNIEDEASVTEVPTVSEEQEVARELLALEGQVDQSPITLYRVNWDYSFESLEYSASDRTFRGRPCAVVRVVSGGKVLAVAHFEKEPASERFRNFPLIHVSSDVSDPEPVLRKLLRLVDQHARDLSGDNRSQFGLIAGRVVSQRWNQGPLVGILNQELEMVWGNGQTWVPSSPMISASAENCRAKISHAGGAKTSEVQTGEAGGSRQIEQGSGAETSEVRALPGK